MNQDKYLAKKDFLSIKKDDIISISRDMDGRIFLNAERKVEDVVWGNEKGKYGKENPFKQGVSYNFYYGARTIHKEVLSLNVSQVPYDHTAPRRSKDPREFICSRHILGKDDWVLQCINNYMQEFIDLKVLEIISSQ